MAAVLDAGPGAVLVRQAAAELFGLPGFGSPRIEVTRPRTRTKRAAPAHEPLLLPAHHVTVVDGIPVTTIARTLFDLCGALHPLRAERAVANAVSRKLVRVSQLHAVALELCRRGRPGSALMRRLLAERGVDARQPESDLEARFLAILAEAGLPLPDLQVDLGGDDGWVGRVDGYYRAQRLDVEIDGELGHTDPLDVAADARRDASLRAAGFEVVRVTEEEVDRHRDVVVAKVTAALASS